MDPEPPAQSALPAQVDDLIHEAWATLVPALEDRVATEAAYQRLRAVDPAMAHELMARAGTVLLARTLVALPRRRRREFDELAPVAAILWLVLERHLGGRAHTALPLDFTELVAVLGRPVATVLWAALSTLDEAVELELVARIRRERDWLLADASDPAGRERPVRAPRSRRRRG